MITASEIARLSASADRLLRMGRFPEAITAYRDLVSQAPDLPDAWYNLGYLQRSTRQFEDALTSYAEAIARGLDRPEDAHVNRAAILSDHVLRTEEAERELLTALAIAPTFLAAWHNLGQLREDHGDRAGARDAYRAVLAFEPNDGRANARIAAIDVFEGRAEEAIERLRGPLSSVRDGIDAADLEFAMANALDAAGDYDAAFARFQRANALGASMMRVRYDPAVQDRLIDSIIAAFPVAAADASASPQQPEPLFICGMFRSGSTLCEQLLARHSRITSGGELEAIPAMVANALSPYPGAMPSVTRERIKTLRDTYLADLHSLFPYAEIVTDKRPDNFLHIGLIKAMFPAARIVHTVRNPLDNILSVFFLYFSDNVTYGARIDDIVHYYRGYRRLMAHWQRLYPDIVETDYDALVRAPETETKSLLTRCGLVWEENCDPARAVTGAVRTASAWQVRQPVHARSTGRWRHYAAHIAGLRDTLGLE